MPQIRRLAINTGGGDCPGLNAVIRAVVLHAHARGIEVLGVEDGLDGLLPNKPAVVRRLAPEEVRPLLAQGGTVLGTTNRGDPFAYADDAGQVHDHSQALLARVRELGIDLLITVGGDGSQHIALKLHALGLPVIGVPKTIDNDLEATVETFGFGTAVQVATDALDRLRTTAESHDRIMLLEVMGRDAGWIALHTGVAGGADVVLLPELPYDPALVARDLRRTLSGGRRFALIVVAEGALSTSEHGGGPRPRGQRIAGGAAQRAAERVAAALPGVELRVTVLGHVQRGGVPTAYDRLLASRLGVEAVEAAMRGESGVLVASHPPDVRTVPLTQACHRVRRVAVDSQILAHARALGISFGDR
jgi:ATP-dependent phosphofructokinase / diphosphate-dependent phosphofructokinase